MLDGFDPRVRNAYFERQRGRALLITSILFGGTLSWSLLAPRPEKTVEVELEPELRDLVVEEVAPEPAPPEPEPPAPATPQPQSKPRPRSAPKIAPKIEKAVPTESSEAKPAREAGAGASTGTGTGKPTAGTAPAKPAPAAEPKPKPKPKPTVDPTKPIDRPEKATLPRPKAGNAQPEYPPQLRDEGITGKIVIKLHIHRDGSVKGAKILLKENSATTEDERNRANKLFLAAVLKVVQTWTYEPAKLEGMPISIWYPVTFPFSLTTG